MKVKDPVSGIVFDSVNEATEHYCDIRNNSCKGCPLNKHTAYGDLLCSAGVYEDTLKMAVEAMGYERVVQK